MFKKKKEKKEGKKSKFNNFEIKGCKRVHS